MLYFLPEEINTPRLKMRSPVITDTSTVFHSYAQDPLVCRFMIWTPHTSESDTRQFISSCIEAWQVGARLPYILTERDSDVAVGMIEARRQGTTVDIGYVLARSHWGKGLMPEAIQSLTSVALSNADIFRVQATCDTENFPSQRALEKSGFNREGRLERYTVHPNISPEPRTCFMYAKCR
jgi:[ribosomal protein S5]-alanine N-acetyltransferase